MLIDFNLALLSLTQNSLSETNLQIQTAPRIKVAIFFFYGAPCTKHFYRVMCFKSFLVRRICRGQSLSFFNNSFSSSIILRPHEFNFVNAKEYQMHIQDLLKHL